MLCYVFIYIKNCCMSVDHIAKALKSSFKALVKKSTGLPADLQNHEPVYHKAKKHGDFTTPS